MTTPDQQTMTKTIPKTISRTPRMQIQPMHLVKSMLVQKAKAETMRTVRTVIPAEMKIDSTKQDVDVDNDGRGL